MTRRQLRESIFQVLFRTEFNEEQEWEEQLELYMQELENPAMPERILVDEMVSESMYKEQISGSTEQEEGSVEKRKERRISLILEEADMKVSEVTDLDLAYIRQKTEQIYGKLPEIDAKISENTEGWSIHRIGKTELAILRLAVYELLYDEDVPEKVAINEAVELAKIYCPEEAKGFVNAVLAKFTR